jgi:hypothetical protein
MTDVLFFRVIRYTVPSGLLMVNTNAVSKDKKE